jgi:2,4-dienoyl-CoA reductase-like NADH-dependent reductase (Old Yellow Enzyme family)/thioredoxin reductase
MSYPHLLSPLEAGRLKLKNRVVFPGHQTLMSQGAVIGDQMTAYYAERAKGGVAAIIVEGGAVHDTTMKFPDYLAFHRPEIIPTLEALRAELWRYGCRTIAQLAHSGSRMSAHDSRLPLWAPSDVKSAISPEIPHAMTAEDIGEVLDGYEQAFRNCAEAGVDGIEIHAAHEYLLGQFLSPLNNHRDDDYGGSLENRFRLLGEVITLGRKTVGDDMVVGVRINGSDLVEGSLDNADYVDVAGHISWIGAVDYISVSAGTSRHNQMIVPPMDTPEGLYVDYAAAIKAAVDVPVFAVGRLKRPELAEEVIATGRADVVAEARSLIADPAWVAKLVDGTPERIRPCIGCNQGCFGYLYTNRAITCAVNPAVGRERRLGIGTAPAGAGRRVLVIGGGPAGMEAAIAAAERGEIVRLVEASSELGGQVRAASSIPTRAELGWIIDHQIAELDRLGVEVNLATKLTAGDVVGSGFDVVVIATGSRPRPEPIPTDGSLTVVAPIEAMAAPATYAGHRVVVVDDVAHFGAYAPAEALHDAGATVSVLTPKLHLGSNLDQATMMTTLQRLAGKGIVLTANSAVVEIADGVVRVRDTLSGAERDESTDVVVAAVGNRANNDLARALAGMRGAPAVDVIGDAAAPRTILEAVREGRAAGRAT